MDAEKLFMALYEAVENEDSIPALETELEKMDELAYAGKLSEGQMADLITRHELRGFVLGCSAMNIISMT